MWFSAALCVCAGAVTYTAVYNVFNFPAGVVPVTEVTAEDEDQLKNYRGNFGDIWDKTFVMVNMHHDALEFTDMDLLDWWYSSSLT